VSALIEAGRFDPPLVVLQPWALALTDEALNKVSVSTLLKLGEVLQKVKTPDLVREHLLRRAEGGSEQVLALVVMAKSLGADVKSECRRLQIPIKILEQHLGSPRLDPMMTNGQE